MTSANVYYLDFIEPLDIEYDPNDRSTWKLPKVLHRERIHVLCDKQYNWEKILSLPMESTRVKTWGYDEEDDEWDCQEDCWDEEDDDGYFESKSMPILTDWIEKMKPFSKELRELLK